jgi:hypothetical protein
MNNLTPILVRAFLSAGILCFSAPLSAQQEDPLNEGMSKLSPKERSKLAAKETTESESDSTYQEVMRQAETAFREDRYEDALAAYEQARKMRPYNVYPKVKIQDLQALLKSRSEEQQGQPDTAQPAPQSTGGSPLPKITGTTPQEVPVALEKPDPHPPTKPATTMPAEQQQPAHEVHAVPLPPAVVPGERVYVEGGAVVTERIIDEEGKMVVYKRVVQRSGQVIHFKDRLPIPAQTWDERFR